MHELIVVCLILCLLIYLIGPSNGNNTCTISKEKFTDTKKKIIFSLTCHEKVDCVIDLIDNLTKCFEPFEVMFLISTINTIENELKERIKVYSNVKIVTVRDSNMRIYWTTKFIHQHMLNIKYLIDNKINFDYLWFVASNEYYIKRVKADFFEKHVKTNFKPRTLDIELVSKTWEKFMNTTHKWHWFNNFKNDTYTIQKFKENNIIPYNNQHEGLVLPANVILEVYNAYMNWNIYTNVSYNFYPSEEIFIQSYVISKYDVTPEDISPFCCHYATNPNYKDKNIDQVFEHALKDDNYLSLKPVKRDYNDPLRVKIRNNLNNN